MAFTRYKLLFIVLITTFHCSAWAEPLKNFTTKILDSINTVDDLKKNNKKIRIRTQAEIQNIEKIEGNKEELSSLLDLLYLSSLANSAEGMKRTDHVLQHWNTFLKVNQRAQIPLENSQLPKLIGQLKTNSNAELSQLIPGFMQSLPDEVYFRMGEGSLLRHCAVLIYWSQAKPALNCLERLEKHFLTQGKKDFIDEVQLQRLQIYIVTHDKAGIQNFLKTKSKPEDQKDQIVQIYGAALEFLQGNAEAAIKKTNEVGDNLKEGKLKFVSAILKAESLALQKKYSEGIEFIEKVFQLRKKKKEAGQDSEDRLLFIQASFYIGDKKPAKALEILQTLDTYPKTLNHMQSILIDTYKCGLWRNLKMKEASTCSEKAKIYSNRLQNYKETDPYTLVALDLMKIWGTSERSSADQAKLQAIKNNISKLRSPADPLFLILNP